MKKNIVLMVVLLSVTTGFIALEKAKVYEEEKAVENAIKNLFDGMRAGDSTAVRNAFTSAPNMQSILLNRESQVAIRDGSLDGFVTAVGTPHPEIWDERVTTYDIKIDGPMASAWTPYKFYIGEKFSHCGVNSIQLAKVDGEWKINYIVDTRRPDNCID